VKPGQIPYVLDIENKESINPLHPHGTLQAFYSGLDGCSTIPPADDQPVSSRVIVEGIRVESMVYGFPKLFRRSMVLSLGIALPCRKLGFDLAEIAKGKFVSWRYFNNSRELLSSIIQLIVLKIPAAESKPAERKAGFFSMPSLSTIKASFIFAPFLQLFGKGKEEPRSG